MSDTKLLKGEVGPNFGGHPFSPLAVGNTIPVVVTCRSVERRTKRDVTATRWVSIYCMSIKRKTVNMHHQLEAVFSPLDCDSSSRLADIMCQGLKKVLFRSKNIVSGIAPPPTTCVSLLRPTCLFRAWHTFRNACVELESLKVETLEVRG